MAVPNVGLTWKRLAYFCAALVAVKLAVSLYALELSPRMYVDSVVRQYFSDAYLKRVATYQLARLPVQRFSLIVSPLFALAFVFGGPLVFLARRPFFKRQTLVLQAALAASAFVVSEAVVLLPAALWSHDIERRFGLSVQTTASYLGDYAKSLGLEVIAAVVVASLFIVLLRVMPKRWPWVMAVSLAFLTIFVVLIEPWLIEPMFQKYTDVPEGELRQAIMKLADTSQLHVQRLLEMDASTKTTRVNAYVAGLWGSHRVVIYDTLLQRYSTPEILSVLGHEFGHSKLNHVAYGLTAGLLGIVASVFLLAALLPRLAKVHPDLTIPALIPSLMMLLSLGLFFSAPVRGFASRCMEAQADHFALDVTRDPASAIAMEKKLEEDNMGNPNPRSLAQFWYGSHPDAIARIQAAEQWSR